MSERNRQEHIAYVRRVSQSEIHNYEARNGDGSFEARSDVITNVTGERFYLILTYDPLKIRNTALRESIIRARVALTFEENQTNPIHGKYGEIIEELPWKE